MREVVIEKAVAGDAPLLAEMIKKLFDIEKDFKSDIANQINGIVMLIEKEQAVVFKALSGDKIIGMVTGQLVVSTASGGYSVLLEDLFVDTDFRLGGVGKALLKNLVTWANQNGALRIQLVADTSNSSAESFYTAMGFSPTRMMGWYQYL
ncbi:MAG TPA: GNAT family N-acetyltransferase [Spirochaetota bacterium]|nr:GNAT family N-acetyltransferase [Spirochaetota bacterium]HOU83753.1 GNAT family N-acetyltransferase [Spirochaetota bacterium]HPK55950.1 GNAT family N-acetyltransferase [Spirochaetota bacterium]HQE57981.1 GNAT family N-acetyltransferase [Spirochaetota bacterium]